MTSKAPHVCPVEVAGGLDSRIRRWVQDPAKILKPFIKSGMTVLDMGCGPGFFAVDAAYLVGASGHVIAADLQQGMLKKVEKKIAGTPIEDRFSLHTCQTNQVGVTEMVDLIIAVFVVHELPDQKAFFAEMKKILKPGSHFLILEPKLFHVLKRSFEKTLDIAREAGFAVSEGPRVFISWSAVLTA